jgi:hypothetical protein
MFPVLDLRNINILIHMLQICFSWYWGVNCSAYYFDQIIIKLTTFQSKLFLPW